jgi:hypothetical protein
MGSKRGQQKVFREGSGVRGEGGRGGAFVGVDHTGEHVGWRGWRSTSVMFEGEGGAKVFMGLLPKSAMVVSHGPPFSFEERGNLKDTAVCVLLKAGHCGALACHMAVASTLTTFGTSVGGAPRKE